MHVDGCIRCSDFCMLHELWTILTYNHDVTPEKRLIATKEKKIIEIKEVAKQQQNSGLCIY